MIASANNRRVPLPIARLLPGLLAGLLAAASLPAFAQPMRITPGAGSESRPPETQPATPSPQAAPQPVPQVNTPPAGNPAAFQAPATIQAPAAPAQTEAPAAAPPATAGSPSSDPVVQIQTLKAPDPSSAGLLGDEAGGLGAAMWRGSRRAGAELAIAALPAPVLSPALRDLQRRLLLTLAEVPEGNGGTPSLLALRVEQLYRLGLVSEAAQLAVPKPAQLQDSVFTRLPISLALLKNDTATACGLGEKALREEPDAPLWLRLAVFCRYDAKNIAGGDLALGLWREAAEPDPAFQAIAAAARGDRAAKVETLGAADTVSLALFRMAKRPLPAKGLEQLAAPILAALTELPDLDAEQRLNLAERAVIAGGISAVRFGQMLAQAEIPEAMRADILAGKNRSARALAFLVQATRAEAAAPARALLLQKVQALAMQRGVMLPVAVALRDALRDLSPAAEATGAAPGVIRLALAAGDTGLARLWRTSLLGNPAPEAKAMAAETWPLLLLADPPREWPAAAYEAWAAHLAEHTPELAPQAQATLLMLAESSGVAVPADAWQQLAIPGLTGTGTPPALAYWRNLLRAADANAKAETLALALASLGPDGLAKADLASLSTALGALRRVKMENDLRSLILEAALARGL